ncbi:MAG: PAAR domain-containing protein [Bacilli bacterium]
MAAIATHMCKTAGHADFPPSQVIASSKSVFINGKSVVLEGDKMLPHTNTKPETHDGVVIASTSKLFIEGKKVAMIGDSISCGDTIAQGSSNVMGS